MSDTHPLPAHADVILIPGLVRSMDLRRPEADAVAWAGGRILAVGGRSEVMAFAGPRTRVVEAPSLCLLPGFHDAHVHLTQHGLELEQVQLQDAPTLEEGLARVAAAAAAQPAGSWILGAGFALQRWGLTGLDRRDLDRVAPQHPVLLRSQDHHSAWANSAALAFAGVDRHTPDPEHGSIVRDADGEPTGLLLELALQLIWSKRPELDLGQLVRALDAAAHDLAAKGVTTVHHMAAEPASYWRALAWRASQAHGAYPLRVWASIPHADLEHALAIGLAGGQGGDDFVIGGAKFFADGALGSRTAWMLDAYPEGGVGVAVDGPEVLRARFELAARAGLTPVTHAIGDAANRAVIEALEATAPVWRSARLRPRIEHVQHLHPDDVARIAKLGVIASMQPIHLTFDAPSIRALFAEHISRAYRMRELLDAGVPLAFGSDTPVASPDVIVGLRAAVTRLAHDGGILGGDQAIGIREALRAYTAGAAYAIGREGRSGELKAGYDADMVLLSHDPVAGLDGLEVVGTLKAGRPTFDPQGLFA
jgi:predicted amidohydrolase YtcJ